MNFLFLNSARKWGGNEKWVYLASDALNKENNTFLAYSHTTVGERFSVPKIHLPFRHEADFQTIAKLVSFVRKKNIDVLIPSKRKDYVIAGIVSRFCSCLNVLRLGIVRDLKNSPIQSFIFNKMADGVIVNAEPIKDKLLESGFSDPGKVRVIYNGLDKDKISARAKEQRMEQPFTFTVTSMGELSSRKGFDMLIRGFARFINQKKIRDAGLIIIGEGSLKNELQKLATSLNVDRYILFKGFLQNPYPCLASSHVFAMTSRNEGISNALLEAALLGNAIITTTSGGGIRSVVKERENGFLLEYGDEDKLATLFNELYTNPELTKQIAGRGTKTVKQMFSMERMSREILAFCKELQKRQHPA